MSNYDKMSVHELLFEAAKDGLQAFWHDAFPELCDLPEIETAIRRAVLREEVVHCNECVYGQWETQAPYGKGEGFACNVVPGKTRPWLGEGTDYCSEGKRKEDTNEPANE